MKVKHLDKVKNLKKIVKRQIYSSIGQNEVTEDNKQHSAEGDDEEQ